MPPNTTPPLRELYENNRFPGPTFLHTRSCQELQSKPLTQEQEKEQKEEEQEEEEEEGQEDEQQEQFLLLIASSCSSVPRCHGNCLLPITGQRSAGGGASAVPPWFTSSQSGGCWFNSRLTQRMS